MKKWNLYYDSFALPLRIVALALFLVAFGTLVKSESFNIFYTIKNSFILLGADIALLCGETLIQIFPLIVLLSLVSKKAHSGVPILMGLLGFVVFEISTMVFSTTSFNSDAYLNLFEISQTTASSFQSQITRYPLNTGLFGIFLIIILTRFSFIRSRNRSTYSLFSFLSKDATGFIYEIILCLLAGFIVAYIYPACYNFLQLFISNIGKNFNSPLNLSLYGLLDRLANMFSLGDMIRKPFWFTALGGSYQSVSGQNILGDVSIWSYFREANGSFAGAGRFITPYYCLNIFVLPSIYLALYFSISNRKERHKKLLLFLAITFITIVCGNPLPLEYLLFFATPLLFIIYLAIVAILFALLASNGLYLGFNFQGSSTLFAMPGSFFDYIINLRNPALFKTVVGIAIVGAVAGIVSFVLTSIYFRYFTYGLVNRSHIKDFVLNLADAVGGLENIEKADSSLFKIIINLKNLEAVSYEKLEKLGARKLVETRSGISLDIGACAHLLAKHLQKEVTKIKRV